MFVKIIRKPLGKRDRNLDVLNYWGAGRPGIHLWAVHVQMSKNGCLVAHPPTWLSPETGDSPDPPKLPHGNMETNNFQIMINHEKTLNVGNLPNMFGQLHDIS